MMCCDRYVSTWPLLLLIMCFRHHVMFLSYNHHVKNILANKQIYWNENNTHNIQDPQLETCECNYMFCFILFTDIIQAQNMNFEFKSNNYELFQVYIKTQEIIINDTDQSTKQFFLPLQLLNYLQFTHKTWCRRILIYKCTTNCNVLQESHSNFPYNFAKELSWTVHLLPLLLRFDNFVAAQHLYYMPNSLLSHLLLYDIWSLLVIIVYYGPNSVFTGSNVKIGRFILIQIDIIMIISPDLSDYNVTLTLAVTG